MLYLHICSITFINVLFLSYISSTLNEAGSSACSALFLLSPSGYRIPLSGINFSLPTNFVYCLNTYTGQTVAYSIYDGRAGAGGMPVLALVGWWPASKKTVTFSQGAY